MAGRGDAAGGGPATALRARAVFDLGAGPAEHAFDAVSISTEDPESLIVALADSEGRHLSIILPRQELKKLLDWRLLMSL